MSFGTAVSQCAYNTHTFSPRMEVIGVDGTPSYTADGRAIAYMRYVLAIRDIVLDATDTDDQLEAIRAKLMLPGQSLAFTNHGFGDLTINAPGGGVRDVNWGPTPIRFTFKPIAGSRACEITWVVECCIPECRTDGSEVALLDFSYDLDIDIEQNGYSTRTYKGVVRIPATRILGTRYTRQSADDYWELIQPAIPPGFIRVKRARSLAANRASLRFTIVDREMGPNPWPAGVVDCQGSHTLVSSNAGATQWNGTFSASYEMVKGTPTETAWKHFVKEASKRFEIARNNARIDAKNAGAQTLLQRITMEEPEVYGRQVANFSVSYLMYCSIPYILKASGLWRPVDDTYNQWITSIGKAVDPRGTAGLRFDPRDDVIVDMCLGVGRFLIGREQAPNRFLKTVPEGEFDKTLPAKEDSWLFYKNMISVEAKDRVSNHQPLPTKEIRRLTGGYTTNPQLVTGDVTAPNRRDVYRMDFGRQAPPSIVQRTNATENILVLTGRALRVGYDIPEPTISKVANITPHKANRPDLEYFRTWTIASFLQPVQAAEWRLRFIVPNPDQTNGNIGVGAPDALRTQRPGVSRGNVNVITPYTD